MTLRDEAKKKLNPPPAETSEPVPFSNALKAVSETPEELRVENYIVLFGGRDLTGEFQKNRDGSKGEYFTPDTELTSEYTKSGVLHVDWEHGQDPDSVGAGRDVVLGYVDWKTARTDERGVFVQRVLNRRNKYLKYIEPLIHEGLVGNSSEAIPDGVLKADNGQIKKWPLRRDTLTVTPMEPRMISDNALAALKALSLETNKGVSEMEQNVDIKALVDAEFAKREAEAAQKAAREAEVLAAREEGKKQAVEELKAAGALKAPAFNSKTTLGFSEEKDAVPAFKHWLVTGQTNQALIAPDSSYDNIQSAKAAWNVTTGASGSYLVPDPLYSQIIAKRDIASWVRSAPVQHFQTPADHLLVPTEGTKHTAFVKTAEAAAYDENEATVGQVDLILYKYTKLVKMSEEFVNFQGTNFDSWLVSALARAEAVTENTIFTTGTGSSEPQGVLTGATSSSITSASATAITPAEMTQLIGKLGAGYNVPGETGFLMANASKWYFKSVSSSNYFAFIPTPSGGDFFGYQAFISDDMPAIAATNKALLFGNFNLYGVVEKPGMLVQRNPYLYMANGQVGLFANIFRGGAVLQSEAFYYMTQHS